MKVRWSFSPKWLAAPAAALMVAIAQVAQACATCGLDPNDPQNDGYRASVFFMLAVPYMIFAIGAIVGFFAYRNGSRRQFTAQRGGPDSETTPDQ